MRKYLVAAVLVVSFAGSALADEIFVMLDMTTKKCVTMKTDPKDQKKFKMLGKYPTLGEAETANAHYDRVQIIPEKTASETGPAATRGQSAAQKVCHGQA